MTLLPRSRLGRNLLVLCFGAAIHAEVVVLILVWDREFAGHLLVCLLDLPISLLGYNRNTGDRFVLGAAVLGGLQWGPLFLGLWKLLGLDVVFYYADRLDNSPLDLVGSNRKGAGAAGPGAWGTRSTGVHPNRSRRGRTGDRGRP